MKHTISAKAVCPYYKHEDLQMIYCIGPQDRSTIHLAFANRTDAIIYKERYCRSSCDRCGINRMLRTIREEQDNDD